MNNETMNLWYFWAKKLHITNSNHEDLYGYCDEVLENGSSNGDGIILETAKGFIELAKKDILNIEFAC